MRTKLIIGLILSGLLLIIIGCDENKSSHKNKIASGGDKTFTIGLMQIVQHPALDAAMAGFKRALQDKKLKVQYIYQNAQGDINNSNVIARNLVSDDVDLIFANSTPCAQSALSATKDIPIIFTSVADPVGAKLVNSLSNPGGNITGTTDNHPDAIPNILKFINKEFDGKRIGMIYNAGEQNSISTLKQIKQFIKDKGTDLKLIPVAITNSSEVKQAAQSLVGRVDFIFINTDNMVASAMKSIVSVCEDEKIPLFVGWMEPVKQEGAFASYGFDFDSLGYQTGEMASKILINKMQPSEIPVEYPKTLMLTINKTAAKKMGVKLKPEWDKIANYVE